MFWAITWDIIGSIYEWNNIKKKDFPLFWEWVFFTDDTVLTVATADAVFNKKPYEEMYREYFRKYPDRWYWWMFSQWALSDDMWAYNSWWNWSAMRVWPVGYLFGTMEETLEEAKKSAECTHNHPEWIKWAQAVASAIYLSRIWTTKDEIKDYIESSFYYDLSKSLDEIRPWYIFNESCQWTVPEAMRCFLESEDFEDAIRNAISIWWDSDTLACIVWSIAEAFYGIPKDIRLKTLKYLNNDMLSIVDKCYWTYSFHTIHRKLKCQ